MIIYLNSMMKWLYLIIIITLLISCAGNQPVEAVLAQAPISIAISDPHPEFIPQPPHVHEVPAPEPIEPEVVENVFDPGMITQEEYETTKADIQHLVAELNRIIRARNYNAWLTYLSHDYRVRLDSREFRAGLIERFPAFRGRINNISDYFNLVIVPSRNNDRVDDIEFITHSQVRAYTETQHGRFILYDLEYINDRWLIIR